MAHRHRLRVKTLTNYSHELTRLMERLIPLEKVRIDACIASYRHYCRYWRLPEPEIRVYRDSGGSYQSSPKKTSC